jgi:hypothetical protein
MRESQAFMKVLGRRRPSARRDLVSAAPLLELAVRLRAGKPLIPPGLHRFRSFEEADEWSLTMMTRSNREHRR